MATLAVAMRPLENQKDISREMPFLCELSLRA